MNVSLTPRLEAIVREKVASGLYNNASEVVREAIRQMDARDQQLNRLRAALAEGIADVEQGNTMIWTETSLAEIIAEADAEDRRGLPIDDNVQP